MCILSDLSLSAQSLAEITSSRYSQIFSSSSARAKWPTSLSAMNLLRAPSGTQLWIVRTYTVDVSRAGKCKVHYIQFPLDLFFATASSQYIPRHYVTFV
jgi:hypothetical protein